VALSVARVPHRPSKWRRAVRRYYTWAELLRRVFGVEIFTCPNCGGARRLLAAIKDPDSIERVLRAVGLPFDAPELAVARAPPDGGGGWLGA
jgi:ribosomal protein L32